MGDGFADNFAAASRAELEAEHGLQTVADARHVRVEPLHAVKLLARALQRCERLALELVELHGFGVGGVFGPSHPDIADGKILEQVLRGQEPRDVVPVLMRDDEHIDPAARLLFKVGDDVGDERRTACDRDVDAAIDQHAEQRTIRLREGEQVAVADALAIVPDGDGRWARRRGTRDIRCPSPCRRPSRHGRRLRRWHAAGRRVPTPRRRNRAL
ncbi:MAG: hypothetical protein E5V88_04200 [Mesorhizobium sp.]|nr:MAG: hypothetical protein E5V88_04200 [Mesorhizobium sp.]